MRSLKLFCALCLLIGTAEAAEEAVADASADVQPTAEAASSDQTRPALVTQYMQRGERLALAETVEWFEVADKRRWMAVQPARGATHGNVLLLADPETAANGGSYVANLREGLARHGWRTQFTNLTGDDAQIEALVNAAFAQTSSQRLVIVAEGDGCVRLVNLPAADQILSRSTGLVCLNVPTAGQQRAVSERLQAFARLSLPTLVLQERPDGWPLYAAVAQDVEVQVMPPGAARRVAAGIDGGLEASQVLRRLRGWLLRREEGV